MYFNYLHISSLFVTISPIAYSKASYSDDCGAGDGTDDGIDDTGDEVPIGGRV